MHVFGAVSWTSSAALRTTRHPSGLPFCGTSAARMDVSSLPRSAPRSRKWRKWKGSSVPCKTSWTRSAREPVGRFRSREASVRLGTAFLLDRWIVSALPSEGLSHETCPVLLHSENVLEELAANGRNMCA
jgi:hypothetical protein